MNNLRSRSAAVALSGGLIVLGGLAVAPALAYPPGTALTISCDAFDYDPGAVAVCTLENIDPTAQNTSIVLGNPPLASGERLTIVQASLGAQDAGNTFVDNVQLPMTPGEYTVVGESGVETATTTVRVNAAGAVEPFGVVVNSDGSVTVKNGTPGCSVTVLVDGVAAGTGTVGADGTVTIPAGAAEGQKVTAEQTESDGCAALQAEVVVAGGGTTGGKEDGGEKLTKAGGDVAWGLVAGLGALGVGGGLFFASRRKKA